jgi:hypothetical protein
MILGLSTIHKRKALDSTIAYRNSFMFLERVLAAEPEFVHSCEKISHKTDLAQHRTSGKTHEFYQTHIYQDS